MRILLTGKNGQVGWELNRTLLPLGEVIAMGKQQMDLSSPDQLRSIVSDTRPDVIVNAAAYTQVDKAEQEENLATEVNGVAPGVLAEEAERMNALLVHYSTDYVFDGAKQGEYTESDKCSPLNAYGRSKLAGEEAIKAASCDHLILRTAWVYSSRGHNFLLSILRLAQEREQLSIVDDQTGSPTWARFIAELSSHVISQSIRERVTGGFESDIYNLGASGRASWFEFASEILNHARNAERYKGMKISSIKAISSDQYPTAAARPKNSVLSTNKLSEKFKLNIAGWSDSLALCFGEIR